jgi:hypothetical protein
MADLDYTISDNRVAIFQNLLFLLGKAAVFVDVSLVKLFRGEFFSS